MADFLRRSTHVDDECIRMREMSLPPPQSLQLLCPAEGIPSIPDSDVVVGARLARSRSYLAPRVANLRCLSAVGAAASGSNFTGRITNPKVLSLLIDCRS